jgi:hypothetical protein
MPLLLFPQIVFPNGELHLWEKKVIISGLSSPQVLSDDGFVHFANAIGL